MTYLLASQTKRREEAGYVSTLWPSAHIRPEPRSLTRPNQTRRDERSHCCQSKCKVIKRGSTKSWMLLLEMCRGNYNRRDLFSGSYLEHAEVVFFHVLCHNFNGLFCVKYRQPKRKRAIVTICLLFCILLTYLAPRFAHWSVALSKSTYLSSNMR